MYKYLIILSLLTPAGVMAQADTAGIVVHKDPRIDQLIHRQMEINEETTRDSRRSMPGFRIQVISATDRNKVFAAKTKIYQQFPDLKPYVLYQPPYYKLRVGNFKTQTEAEEFEKQLSSLFPSGLYVIRDTIEVTPERLKEEGPQ
ncbi:MAG: SPOR domain-containing protein [Chitinophagaceae bacterium]|nr:SPOR domain-containing protein [Chitinophagaceae bacterium]